MSIERAQLSVKFSIERLRAQTKDLFDQQYPGDHNGPRKWLDLVSGLLDTADEFLIASQQSNKKDEALSLARDAANLGNGAYQCLSVMRGATVDELPYPLVPPLQRWFDQLGLVNTTFFRAELVVNYELKSFEEGNFKRIRNPSKSLSKAIKEISWPILRVTVPSRAFAILPHFAIVAHEIGHALTSRINWDLSNFKQQEEASLIQRICQRIGVKNLDSDTVDALQSSFASWFQELAADAFALYLTGPAIFFSLSEFFQLLGGDYGLSCTHPANDLRRKILFDELQKGEADSFAEIFCRHTGQKLTEDFNSPLLVATPSKDEIFQDMKKIYKKDTDAAVLTELHGSIPKVVAVIYSNVKQYMQQNAPEALYTSLRYDQDLKAHLQPMLAAIPPNETGTELSKKVPTEFASILNVGWATLLTKLPELRVKTDDGSLAEKLERLHGLLLKAAELSEARRLWGSA